MSEAPPRKKEGSGPGGARPRTFFLPGWGLTHIYTPRFRRLLFRVNGQRQRIKISRFEIKATSEKEKNSLTLTGLARSTSSQRRNMANGQVASQESAVRTSIFAGSVAISARKAPVQGETRNHAVRKGTATQIVWRKLTPLPCALVPSEAKIKKQRTSPTASEMTRVLFDISWMRRRGWTSAVSLVEAAGCLWLGGRSLICLRRRALLAFCIVDL